jgi:hypothetical protein
MLGLAASAMFAAALYHSVAVVIPAFGRYAYPSTYPLWRHVGFIAINVTLGSMLIARSNFLLWAFVLLTAQIYSGHGVSLWAAWTREGRIALIDLISVIGSTAIVVLLVIDRRTTRGPKDDLART